MNTPIDKVAESLKILVDRGCISSSKIKSKKLKEVFNHLLLSEIVKVQRKGAGNEYSVINLHALENHIERAYPNGLFKNSLQQNRRIQGIAEKADSKGLCGLDFELLTLCGNTVLEMNNASFDLNLFQLPAYLSLQITEADKLSLKDKCTVWTIENPTAFINAPQIQRTGTSLDVYTAGKMSNLLIDKLTKLASDGHELIHFGDSDYVGLLEFCRILEVNDKAQLHIPAELDKEFLEKYGNVLLLQKQVDQHTQLLSKMKNIPDSKGKKQLQKVYDLIQAASKGLEQEAFFVRPTFEKASS
jgi:hypothetical protein